MNNQPQEQEDWRIRLFKSDIGSVLNAVLTPAESAMLDNFITTEIKRAKAETYQEAIALSDGIEIEAVKYSGTPLEEWKAFKHFRNTLHDKLKQL